jgi:hypothetical protein
VLERALPGDPGVALPGLDFVRMGEGDRPIGSNRVADELVRGERRHDDESLNPAVVRVDEPPQARHAGIVRGETRMPVLHALLFVSLAVFAVSLLAGSAVAGMRGLRLWRTFRSFQRNIEGAVADASQRLAGTEQRVEGASSATAELQRAVARLQSGLGELTVLTRAGAQAWGLLGRLLAVLPSK